MFPGRLHKVLFSKPGILVYILLHCILLIGVFFLFRLLVAIDKEKMKSEALKFSLDLVPFFDKKSFVFYNIDVQLIESTAIFLTGKLQARTQVQAND